MRGIGRVRAGWMAGTALSGAALLGVGSGWADGLSRPDGRFDLAQGAGSMMSTPRAAAPAPAAPQSGSSMMNTPRPAAPAPSRPAAAPPAVPPVAVAPPVARPPAVAAPAAPVPPAPPPAAAASPPAAPKVAGLPVPVLGPYSLARTATGYTANNLRLRLGRAELLVPRAEISGTTLPAEELTALLDPAAPTPLAERFARLDADAIVIPSLALNDDGKVLSLSGVTIRRLASGLIGALEIAGATTGQLNVAHMAASDLDIGLFTRLVAPAPPSSGQPEAGGKLYSTLSIEGFAPAVPTESGAFGIARIAGRDLTLKPTAHGWMNDIDTIGSTDTQTPTPEARQRSHAAMADLFEAVSIGSFEISGLGTSDPAASTVFRIGRLALTGAGPSGGADFQVDGFDAGGQGGRVSVASTTIGGVSLQSALGAFRSSAESLPGRASPEDLRRFIPTVGLFRMSGIGIDADSSPGGAPMHIDVATVEGRASKPVDGIPTDTQFTVQNITVPASAATGPDGANQLAGLGYDRVVASFGTSMVWNEAAKEIALRDLSVQAAGMGSLTVRGTLGNVGRDLFNPDSAIASVAAISLTARALDLTIRNEGLAERLLARESKAQNRPAEDIRREMGVGAAVLVPAMIGDTPAARLLGQALGRFVAKPGTLTVQLRAKDPLGYGFTDYAASPNPVAALEKFDVTATAE